MGDADYEDVSFDRPQRRNIMELLQQKKHWIPANGVQIKLKDMHPAHRANLLAWFERRALYLQTADAVHVIAFEDANSLGGRSWSPDRVLEVELKQDPIEWLNCWPLIKRLRKLVAEDKAARTPQQLRREWIDAHWRAGTLGTIRARSADVGDGHTKWWAHGQGQYVETTMPSGIVLYRYKVAQNGRRDIELIDTNGRIVASSTIAV